MRVTETNVADIVVGERFRKDVGDLDTLAAAIKERGLLQPITIDKDDPPKLIAGCHRIFAVQSLGWKEMSTLAIDAPEEIDAREIELMENIERKDMTWDERALLERRIFDLKREKDPDWTMDKQSEATGKSRGGISRRLHLAKVLDVVPELADCVTEDEAWKQYKKLEETAVVKRLKETVPIEYKGAYKDAEKHFVTDDALLRLPKVKDGSVGFAEVDPPYGIELPESKKQRSKKAATRSLDAYNEIFWKDYPAFLEAIATETYRILAPDAFCVWWFGYPWYGQVRSTLTKAGFKVNPIPAVWVKGRSGQTASPDTMLGS